MTPRIAVVFDWAMIAAAFGFVLFILLSPTGSLVRAPVEVGRTGAVARLSTAIVMVEAAPPAAPDVRLRGRSD